jgi:hypothetical protein
VTSCPYLKNSLISFDARLPFIAPMPNGSHVLPPLVRRWSEPFSLVVQSIYVIELKQQRA